MERNGRPKHLHQETKKTKRNEVFNRVVAVLNVLIEINEGRKKTNEKTAEPTNEVNAQNIFNSSSFGPANWQSWTPVDNQYQLIFGKIRSILQTKERLFWNFF